MIGIQITDTASPMLKKLQPSVSEHFAKNVLRAAQDAAGEIRKVIMSTSKGRTGKLARSFKAEFVSVGSGRVSAGAFSDLSYADIQDRGGTIRPKTMKRLAVPIMSGKNLPVGKWPRHFAKGQLTFIPRKGKAPLLAKVTRTRVTPLFVLMASVKIKPKRYLRAARPKAEAAAHKILGEHVTAAVKKARQ